MRWQFHYAKRNAFYPPDYEDPGLGGSEAALVLVTRALARRGHEVEVFNCCYKPGNYDGVRWRMSWELENADVPDVAVAARFSESLWPQLELASRRVFWMLDDRTEGVVAFERRVGAKGGTVVLASEEMNRVLRAAGTRVPVQMVPLPVEVDRYRTRARERACLYMSMPNRGLDVVLKLWPRIRDEVSDAALWVTSGWRLWGYTHSEADDRWKQFLGDRALPAGVERFGELPRQALIELQDSAWLTLYPCRFPEMFCLAAAESAAAGTPVIASAVYALPERVEDGRTGVLIPGEIDEQATQDQFIKEAIDLLGDRQRRDAYGHAAAADAKRTYAPDSVARAWEQLVA